MTRPCTDARSTMDARWRRVTTAQKTADVREAEARSLAHLVASGDVPRRALDRRTDHIGVRAREILEDLK